MGESRRTSPAGRGRWRPAGRGWGGSPGRYDRRAMSAVRRLLVVLGTAVAVVLVAEVGVRLFLAADLPAVEQWPDATTAAKVEQMERIGCADVVFVGNSVARDDLDPETFFVEDPALRSVYNAALDAAGPVQIARWLPEEVISRLDPQVVVWALTSPDLNDAAPAGQAALHSYETSIAGRPDLIGRLQRPLVDHVALVRHREALTDPSAVWDALTGVSSARAEAGSDLIGFRGEGRSRANLRYLPGDPGVTGFVRDQLLADYTIGGAQVAAARDLVEDLEAGGRQVVLLMPPVTDEFIGLHPDPSAWEDYRSAVHDLAAETGAQLVDLTGSGDESWFADTHHLNADGARRLTRELVAAVPGERACPVESRVLPTTETTP